ncbi:sporulation inhibitor of replication protein SirA [Robertmurraya yapensis]|uniref:Sporulation inhibitor of replication protein SirA n=2 Tax=Bacillaceae TaxID=186817 RepID=A0A3S0RT57_9BACI|nr:sporulation inhibitor of replication protein SirA [Bacillus yapensis]RTR35677.1 sporulation inhibitor of replication protein SirA [Bacillus yapensis]TKS98479.1 sporulation inhibitor of replication protein SirA [Bacillus yapensis]
MRTYQLYIIDDEFASHYFGREHMFFRLFKEYEEAHGELQSIIRKQIQYITKSIPSIRFHQSIQQQLQNHNGFSMEQGLYILDQGRGSSARLEIFDRYFLLESQGNYEAETSFFEVLRKNERSILAIDLKNNHYGWLKPIKERKFV